MNGRQVMKYTYQSTANTQTQAGTGGTESGILVDKETGVGPWFKPITLQYDFTFAGIGKKGGY